VVLDPYQCINCGVCARTCPSGALELKPEIEKDIFSQMEECFRKGEKAYLICKKIGKKSLFSSEDSLIEFPCLAVVDESLLLLFAARGLREIRLVTFQCDNCQNKKGLSIIRETVKIGKQLLEILDLEKCNLAEIKTQIRRDALEAPVSSPEQIHFSRRELLTSLRNIPLEFGINASKIVIDTFLPEGKEERFKWGKNIPRKHQRLIKALQDLAVEDFKKTDVSHLPPKKVSVNDNCSGCNICSILCPTGALRRVEKDNSVVISFNIRHCVGCGLCQEACPEKAIRYENEVTLDEILGGYQRKLQEITLFQCQLCQSKYSSRQGESFCPSCRRRKSSSLSGQNLGSLSQKRGEAGNVRDRFA
jgi:formate hydrogenlyase subunit 6/NADH:ubiquinone oxidoreductase subunit I